MTIVFLNPIGEMGGAEVALLNLLAGLRQARPEWRLHLIVAADGPFAARAAGLGVDADSLKFPTLLARLGDASAGGPAGHRVGRFALIFHLLIALPASAVYTWRLRRLLRQLNPDIVHTNGFKMHLIAAMAKPRRVPLIWHIHDYVRSRPLMARMMKLLRRRCRIVLTNSHSVAVDVKNTLGEKTPVEILYNAVDTKVFCPDGQRLDLDLLAGLAPTGKSTLKVGMLATLARWKGHETFLRAISLLPRELPVRGYVIGDALYQTDGSQYSIAELRGLAEELGISDRIGFTGFIDQPAAAMRSLDIVVHASTEPEPFGLVIAEGMACGRAVIGSHAGGVLEILDAGVNGLSHAPGDAKQLAERIASLAADSQLRQSLGKAGRLTVEERFSSGRLTSKLIPIYQDCVATELNARLELGHASN